MRKFGPIQPHGLAAQVATLISSQIFEGQLTPGRRLPPERELAAQFQVSRPTVREAVHVLEALGLLEIRQGDGTYVSRKPSALSPHILRHMLEKDDLLLLDMVELRKEFEVRNAELAAQHATEEEIRRLAEILDQIHGDVRAGRDDSERDIDFHLAVAEASHNRMRFFITTSMLVAHADTLRAARLRQIEGNARVLQDFLAEHRAVYLGIAARKPGQARRAMLRHLQRAYARQAALVSKPQ